MRRAIRNLFQIFWNWVRRKLPDKCGELRFGEDKPERESKDEIIEREIIINNTRIHIKSIFTGQTRLDEAMKNIIVRKLLETKKPT